MEGAGEAITPVGPAPVHIDGIGQLGEEFGWDEWGKRGLRWAWSWEGANQWRDRWESVLDLSAVAAAVRVAYGGGLEVYSGPGTGEAVALLWDRKEEWGDGGSPWVAGLPGVHVSLFGSSPY